MPMDRRWIIRALLALLAGLTAFSGSSHAGQGEWTSHFSDDVLGNSVDYTVITKDKTFLMGLTVFRDQVYIRTSPLPWTETITIEVAGGSLSKMYTAGDKNCELALQNIVFIITGDRAREIIQAFEKGTSVVIRDVFRPWEFEPRGTFPLQGFKAAYERAMKGKGAQDSGK
jgi:hypothetical protein